MRIAISGASGFIGSHLVRSLAPEHELALLVHQQAPRDVPASAKLVACDLSSGTALVDALPRPMDAVIHLAQSHHYRDFPGRASDIFDVNVGGCMALLEYARQAGAERFVYASSGGIYGFNTEKQVEEHPISPINFYLSSKYCAELLVANYGEFFQTVLLRPFFVYGPGQRGMLIGGLLDKLLGGDPITIQGRPGIRTNPIYVEDAVRVISSALRLDRSAVINVAGDEVVSITDLVRMMEALTGREAIIRYDEASDQAGDLIGDNSRMKDQLKVVPSVPLEQGLRAVLEARG